MAGESLEERIEQALRPPGDQATGLRVDHARVLPRLLAAVAAWLREDEALWRDAGETTVAEALRDLRQNQLRKEG